MKAISLQRITRMVERDANEGICLACGATAHNVEPDAHEYTCPKCGEPKVYGAEELLMRSVV